MKKESLKAQADKIGAAISAGIIGDADKLLDAIQMRLEEDQDQGKEGKPEFKLGVSIRLDLSDANEPTADISYGVRRKITVPASAEIPGQTDAFEDLNDDHDGGEYLVRPVAVNGKAVR